MQKVLVLSSTKKPLMPCSPKRARELLTKRKAAVYRMFPFTIILKFRADGVTQPVELKLDPGSKTTGIALTSQNKVLFAADLNHRGQQVKKALDSRRALRRGRRGRKTRYRDPRFNNRTRPKGWLPPSLMSRVDNVEAWFKKLQRFIPISSVDIETVRFDMQKIVNPEISGTEYQQGELFGYEVREYLLEKWNRTCAYCGKKNIPLEIEHITPKSRGGSNRVSNLTLACSPCNVAKGNIPVEEFLKGDKPLLKRILTRSKAPLRDAAAVNATRIAIGEMLKSFGLPVSFWSGGRTKHNRVKQGYPKEHWVDAACVGEGGARVHISEKMVPLIITATGRGSRQMCRVDRFGFPRTKAKSVKRVKGFQTGDMVRAVVEKGKKAGRYFGRVAIRASGSFNIKQSKETIQGIGWRWCQLIQRMDGYAYAFLPALKGGVSCEGTR